MTADREVLSMARRGCYGFAMTCSPEADALPDDVNALRALVRRLRADHAQELAAREATIARLSEQVRLLLAGRFGASSERAADAQLGLFNEAEHEFEALGEADAAPELAEVPAHTRERPKRKALDPALARVDVVHDLDEHDKRCPHDGAALECIGKVESEQLDVVPVTIHVLRHQRLKYACPRCKAFIKTAPMPAHPIPKSQASPGLLAFIATGKYVDALPLYRQAKQLERIGLECSRTTLARWMVRCGELVQPLINLLRDELVALDYLQCDETTVQVLKEPGKAAQTHSYLWVQRSGLPQRPIVLFDYDPTRSGEVPKRLLEGFKGTLQTDGYAGYDAVTKAQGLTRAYCMAHARRYFTDALKAKGVNPNKLPAKPVKGTTRHLKALGFFKTLYTIERRIRERPPDERQRIREAQSRPVLEKFKAWLDELAPRVRPESKLAEAVAYTRKHWDGLIRFCDDGRLAIDNNAVENDVRPFCVGRRNWLFSDSVAGARSSANLYSLIATAKASGLEPYAYLRHVFTELPKADSLEAIEALLPYRLDPSRLTRNPK
jgi:transposase